MNANIKPVLLLGCVSMVVIALSIFYVLYSFECPPFIIYTIFVCISLLSICVFIDRIAENFGKTGELNDKAYN